MRLPHFPVQVTLLKQFFLCAGCFNPAVVDQNETAIQEALSRLIRNKTVIVIAHRMRTVSGADKIVVLADGKIAETGNPAELLAREGSMFGRMARLQAAGAEWSI